MKLHEISHGQVASKVVKHKAEHPELYCPQKGCLWRTKGEYCSRHKPPSKETK